jgi:hypothetical protein
LAERASLSVHRSSSFRVLQPCLPDLPYLPYLPYPPYPPYRRHVRCRPPSIGMVSPVIQFARSEARYRINDAISSGLPGRPSGWVSVDRSRNFEYCSSPMPDRRCRLVTVTPGLTAFTRTPSGAISSAAQRVR